MEPQNEITFFFTQITQIAQIKILMDFWGISRG